MIKPYSGLSDRTIRTLIVDDEPLARERIRLLLEGDPEIFVVGECADGLAAVEAIRAERPDLVLLDIEMPGCSGFETLSALDIEDLPFVVFVTAYDVHAVRAFEVHALDYVLKPFDDDRFLEALARAKTESAHARDAVFAARVVDMLADREQVPHNGASSPAVAARVDRPRPEAANGYLTRIVVKRSGRVYLVEVDAIDWFEAADYYVRVHTRAESYLIRTSMKALERSLDPARFFRIHRSSIVRIEGIRELQPYFRGEYVVLLDDGTRLALSRSRRKALEEVLGQRI